MMDVDIIKAVVEEVTSVKDLDEDQNLLESGVIDSFGILQLILRLEKELEVNIPDCELTAYNFASLSSIRRLFLQDD